nr:uncharacterized protein LOC113689748 [Coffea arabica]
MRPGRMWNGASRSADRLGAWTSADWGGGQSRAVDMPVETPSPRSWRGSARHRRASASARSRCWPAGTPFGPS